MQFFRKWSLALVPLVVAAAACADAPTTTAPADSDPAFAKVPGYDGDQSDIGRLVFKWNVIGTPGDYAGLCGNGHRIFINRNASHAHIDIEYDTSWYIDDCNATGGNDAVLYADGTEGQTLQYKVFIRLLGKPGGTLRICSDTDVDHASGDHLCEIGEIDLTRGAGQPISFKINDLFGDPLEDVIWSTYTNEDFRIAEFRVYECL